MPALYGILVATNFIACVGIWYFKQWGAQLYLFSFFGRVLFFVFIRQYTPGFFVNLVISLVFIAILLRFYNRMDQDL